MSSNKKYYHAIDLIRLIACFAILLYHLNILKGGYLAVCTFFVLSGYLSCISAFRKEKFSIVSYYLNRLLKIYLPLILVVFITIAVISFLPDVLWLNLKPETTSVLLGYNNFWQLSANLDYFARHINSPFMHFWYIGILLQFELVFPFIYLLFRKIGDKIHKSIPCIITMLLSILTSIYFYQMSLTNNIMATYYSTFTRIFSLLFGVSLGFIHSYYGPLIFKPLKKNFISKIIFSIYLLLVIILFVLIDSKSIYFPISMIGVTLITCRLIDYGTIIAKMRISIKDRFVKILSSISYEVYLFQYPIIFLMQYVLISNYLRIPIIIILTFILSYIIHSCISFKDKSKITKICKYGIRIIILGVALYGGYQYYRAEDHTKEMNALKEQLTENEEMLKKKQEEYESQLKQEEEDWLSQLVELENGEKELKNIVTNLQVVGIGDSVMLGAVDNLYQTFPNSYFDAKVSRSIWVAGELLQDLKNKNMLGDPIVINLGANGDCSYSCKVEIMKKCQGHKVFWLNVTNDAEVHFNDNLLSFASKYDNLYVIDWESISKGHSEYFYADGIHLTETGKVAYTKTIYDAIYKVYLDEYNEKKSEIIHRHEEELKNKITFFGNDILLGAFDDIKNDYSDANFIIDKKFSYKTLKSKIEAMKSDNSLTNKIVFAFDSTAKLTKEQYLELIKLCDDSQIYIILINKDDINNFSDINDNNVTIIDFYTEIKKHSKYIMADKVHLTEEGNKALSNILINNIK